MLTGILQVILIALGIGGIVLTHKKFPDRSGELYGMRNLEGDEAIERRGKIQREADLRSTLPWSIALLVLLGLFLLAELPN